MRSPLSRSPLARSPSACSFRAAPAVAAAARGARAVGVAALLAAAVAVASPSGLPAAAQDSGGIGVEEYFRVFPPAPVEVRAAVEAGTVVVTWTPPAPVARAGLAYDPVVVAYRIYRVDEAGGQALLGEVGGEATRFRDPSPPSSAKRYAVTAVQRSGHESGLSESARAP